MRERETKERERERERERESKRERGREGERGEQSFGSDHSPSILFARFTQFGQRLLVDVRQICMLAVASWGCELT